MTAPLADRALRVERLCCVRGDRELFRDLDFELEAGDLVHLKGRNGSGKTTLLRALAGLLMPESGAILWHGESIRKLREDYARHLLFIGHLNGIKGDLTAVENLRIAATLDGYPLDEPSAWRILGEIGLRGHEDLPTKYLSQGQKRRVSLARLFANSAALWILDEPFSALDVAAVELLQDSISRHIAGGGMAVVTTHQAVGLIDEQTRVIELGRRDV
ncbi:MAG: cytochrome c biogenesis heme-transporting ATPase CcmA [Chromatiaceae bacterium]|jgi:heme exporter protein A